MNTIAPAPLAKIVIARLPNHDEYVAVHAHVFRNGLHAYSMGVYVCHVPGEVYELGGRVQTATALLRMGLDATQIRLVIEPDALDALGPDIAQEVLADFNKGLNA